MGGENRPADTLRLLNVELAFLLQCRIFRERAIVAFNIWAASDCVPGGIVRVSGSSIEREMGMIWEKATAVVSVVLSIGCGAGFGQEGARPAVAGGVPDMCLDASPGNTFEVDGCYLLGESIVVEVVMTESATEMFGAQFSLEYDSGSLTLFGVSAGGSDPQSSFPNETFVSVVSSDVDPDGGGPGVGYIDVEIGNMAGPPAGTMGPATVATLYFSGQVRCDVPGVIYRSPAKPVTGFFDGAGKLVIPSGLANGTPCETGAFTVVDDEPEYECPFFNGSINEVASNCGVTTRNMSYGPIVAIE